MITKLLLENWRSHRKTEFEFGKGSNVLIGRMGAGKSSAVNAICFAFFGTYPELQRRDASHEAIIMDRPLNQSFARIKMQFTHNKKEYTVERIINAKKANEAKLYENNTLIAGPKVSDVNKKITQLLETDFELFSRAIYAEQNQIDYLLKLSPAERKTKFDQMLDLERYENARKNAVTLRNSLKNMLEERKNALEEYKKNLDLNAMKELEKEIEKIEQDTKKKEEERINAVKEFNSFKEKTEKLAEKQKKHSELKEKTAELNASISFLKQQIEKTGNKLGKEIKATEKQNAAAKKKTVENSLKELEETEKKINELKTNQSTKKALANQLQETIHKALQQLPENAGDKQNTMEKIKQIESKIKENEKQINENRESRRALEEELSRIRKKIAVQEEKIKESKERKEKLQTTEANCPTCTQTLSETQKKQLLEEAEKRIAGCEAEAKNLKQAEDDVLKKIELHSKKEEKTVKEKESLGEMRTVFQNCLEKIKEIEENNEKKKALEKEIEKLESEEKQFSGTKEEIEKKKQELEKIKEELEAIENAEKLAEKEEELKTEKKAIEELAFSEEEYSNAKAELEKRNSTAKSIETAIENMQSLLKEKKARMQEFEEKKQLVEKLSESVKRSDKAIEKLGIFINALKSAQAELRTSLIDTINQAMAELWEKVYPYPDYTGLKLVADESYSVKVKTKNGWMPIEGILSGGERSVAALILRIASSFVLASKTSLLILDEPTHNLDQKTIEVLSKMIKEVLPGFVEQIFLITHDKEMESAASSYLYSLEKEQEKGISNVKQIAIRD